VKKKVIYLPFIELQGQCLVQSKWCKTKKKENKPCGDNGSLVLGPGC
jgi:hypothetical protein